MMLFMKKATLNWLQSSEYDLSTAATLLKNRRYIYVAFMCHLALEKTLKAVLSEMYKELPPYTHNLNRLIELANISLPEGHQVFVNKINLQSVPTRYPEDFKSFQKSSTGKLRKIIYNRQRR